jgi:hypothetical protein
MMCNCEALTRLLDAAQAIADVDKPVPADRFTCYWLDESGALQSAEVELDDAELSEVSADVSAASYTKEIRGIARLVWQGVQGIDAFGLMWNVVGIGMVNAWARGAASCGIDEPDLTVEERVRRDMLVIEQRNYVFGFLEWVHVHRRDGENKLLWAAIQPRINTWGNAWNRAYNEARARACGDIKLKWVLHGRRVTKKSCPDCLKLAGRIYRASIWAKYRIFPQSPELACGGFNCGCDWGDVGPDERATGGRPPRLSRQ